ncbi:hypothetical protein [Nocardia brevicatena]|uniref:hypothetical protein n=1 Tax=Nocardia brevicatena TaxID=37327 RepID=UPI001C3F2B34|nr:hypothetical protein [Nocardia brevicatena]
MEFVALHGPDHTAVAIICADPDSETWGWAKWLPHLQHPVDRDGLGSRRMMYRSPAELETAMAAELLERGRFMRNAQPTAGRTHLLVIIDDGYVSGAERIVSDAGLDSGSDAETPAEGVGEAKQQLNALYGGRRAPEVRMLPLQTPREQVLEVVRRYGIGLGPTRVAVGIGESELQPLVLDFDAQPHFMAFADVECGKTTLLRNIVMCLAENSNADQARVILIDYRRTRLGVLEGDQLAGYSTSSQTSVAVIKEVAAYLTRRIPGSDITPKQLRERSWWSGPEIYVVVDDYDMVAAGQNLLEPLLEFLPQARDTGMHLIIARRSGGAARALYDKVLGRMKDLSVDALLMSAPKDEGKFLDDVRAAKLPAGRGTLISRHRSEPEMIQVAYLPPI